MRDEFGTPRRTEIADGGSDMDDEDLIAARGHGRHRHAMPATSSACRCRPTGRSAAAARAAPAWRRKDEDFVTRLFVANTHTPVLFFSSRGIVYKEKVWRLPIGNAAVARQGADQHAAARAGRTHHHDHAAAGGRERAGTNLDVMFATTRGTVRRNKLSDFVQVNRNGKIAMKLEEEGDEILGVETCTDNDDVLLTDRARPVHPLPGRRRARVRRAATRSACAASRWATTTASSRWRSSAMSMRRRAERAAYLKRAAAERRGRRRRRGRDRAGRRGGRRDDATLSDERYEELKAHEQFVLTVSEYGYGKRSSSYDFRTDGRGGKGIRATDASKTAEIGELVAAFPVGDDDQIMLVSDGGQVIRVPVDGIRIASRATKGVTIFNTAEGEKVVSVERISEPQGEDDGDEAPNGDGPVSEDSLINCRALKESSFKALGGSPAS